MSKPCADTPAYLWVSDFLGAKPAGNREHVSKVPWTPALAARCHAMREAGDTWVEIAAMLKDETGVVISDGGVRDYIERVYGEK